MKKRVLFTVLGALMVSGLCTGCGSSTENEPTSSHGPITFKKAD